MHSFQVLTSNPERNFAATLLDTGSLVSSQAVSDEMAVGGPGVYWSGLTVAVRNEPRNPPHLACARRGFPNLTCRPRRSQANDAFQNLTRVATFASTPVWWMDEPQPTGAVTVMFNWDTVSASPARQTFQNAAALGQCSAARQSDNRPPARRSSTRPSRTRRRRPWSSGACARRLGTSSAEFSRSAGTATPPSTSGRARCWQGYNRLAFALLPRFSPPICGIDPGGIPQATCMTVRWSNT